MSFKGSFSVNARLLLCALISSSTLILSVENCMAKTAGQGCISPQVLKNNANAKKCTIIPSDEEGEQETGLNEDGFIIDFDAELEREIFNEKLDELQKALKERNKDIAFVKEMLVELKKQDPSHHYVEKLVDFEKALNLLAKKLDDLEKKKNEVPPINNNVHVVVGNDPSISTVKTFSNVFTKMVQAVQYFGPSLICLYVVYQMYSLLQGHRSAMELMIDAMGRMSLALTNHSLVLAQQAVADNTSMPTMLTPTIEPVGANWSSYLYTGMSTVVQMLPLMLYIMPMIPSVKIPFLGSIGGKVLGAIGLGGKVLGRAAVPLPTGYRYIAGQFVPLR